MGLDAFVVYGGFCIDAPASCSGVSHWLMVCMCLATLLKDEGKDSHMCWLVGINIVNAWDLWVGAENWGVWYIWRRVFRVVAQPGSALRSGRRGRWFESSLPDKKNSDLILGRYFLYAQDFQTFFQLLSIKPGKHSRITFIMLLKSLSSIMCSFL